MKAKMKLNKLKFDSLEEDHSYKKLQLGKLSGPKLTAIVHREMDLPIFWLVSNIDIHFICFDGTGVYAVCFRSQFSLF